MVNFKKATKITINYHKNYRITDVKHFTWC